MLTTRGKFLFFATTASAIQLILTIYSIVVSFALGMRRFDDPNMPLTTLEQLTAAASSVLMQPAMIGLMALGIKPNSSVSEWVFITINSLIWGFGLAYLIKYLTRRST